MEAARVDGKCHVPSWVGIAADPDLGDRNVGVHFNGDLDTAVVRKQRHGFVGRGTHEPPEINATRTCGGLHVRGHAYGERRPFQAPLCRTSAAPAGEQT